jgi:hypothetical protein
MPTEPEPITIFDVVKRAVDICDPDGADDDVTYFLQRFEDADEPVPGLGDAPQQFAEAAGARDPEQENPVLQMTAATATYLLFRRDELDDDPDDVLRLAARAEYAGNPPEPMASWLADAGIEI